MAWRTYLHNRFVLTFGIIAIAVLIWNIYVALNDDGRITGQVVDPAGQPVPQATVVLARNTVTSVETVGKTTTNEQGRFTFDDHGQFSIVLTASKGEQESSRRTIPLWFRNQNINITPPLTITK